jgi:hypothetical protein
LTRALLDQHAIVDDSPPAVRAAHPALDRQPRDARDRGQRFAAKTERFDCFDRIVGQLGGGVSFERERDLGGAHPAAVVRHLDPRQTALAQGDRDPQRSRVDRILDQFLERTGGAFDHLAGSDAVDQMLWQAAY